MPSLASSVSRFDDDLPTFGEIMPATAAKIVVIDFKSCELLLLIYDGLDGRDKATIRRFEIF
jgi:hypothetical protein